MQHVVVRRAFNLTFLAKGKSGHWTAMDNDEESGGDDGAARPKELLLFALGGCTGFDVASILRKKRLDVREFLLDLEADTREELPKVFTEVRLTYRVDGPGIPPEDVLRAIHLSQEKYCSVSAMLRLAFPIRWKAIVNGVEVGAGIEGEAAGPISEREGS